MAKLPANHDIGLGQQILLHLVPGFLTTLAYIPLGAYFYNRGLPSILGFYVATLLVLFPIEIGLPFVRERRKNPEIRINDIFLFQNKQPTWHIILLVVGLLVWAGLVFLTASSILVNPVREGLFSWVPDWLDIGHYLMNSQMYPRSTRIFTWAVGIIFAALLGPIIEEFYFRSYLLPRMSSLKGWAPLVGTLLMTLYHFWSPWLFLVRVIAMVPMVYAVWWKKNVYISIYAHCLLNLVGDVLSSIPIVFG
jgi:membrane protease YdiL (CAAX protease family)